MNIKKVGPASLESVKRFYSGYEITDKCPECGAEVEACQTSDYFMYPDAGRSEVVTFYCERGDDCEGWTKYVVIDVAVREGSKDE